MERQFRWIVLFLLLLAVPALACDALSGGEEAAPTVAPTAEVADEELTESTSTPVPTATEAPAPSLEPTATGPSAPSVDAPDLSDLGALNESLEEFSSYRLHITIEFEGSGDDPDSGLISMDVARVVAPPASSITMQVEGDFAEASGASGMEEAVISMTEIGDEAYMVLPGLGCVSGSAGEFGGGADEFVDIFDNEDLFGELNDPEFVGEEEVNGVATYHYRFDETNVETEGDLDELDGDIYISQEYGYVVRMEISGTGMMDLFDQGVEEQGSVYVEYDVSDVDAEITVEAPTDCDGAGSDYPVMEGASEVASFGGLTSYSIEAPLDDVIAFYQEEMTARGYQEGEGQLIMEGTAILPFTHAEQPDVTVTISEGDEGIVNVLISSGE